MSSTHTHTHTHTRVEDKPTAEKELGRRMPEERSARRPTRRSPSRNRAWPKWPKYLSLKRHGQGKGTGHAIQRRRKNLTRNSKRFRSPRVKLFGEGRDPFMSAVVSALASLLKDTLAMNRSCMLYLLCGHLKFASTERVLPFQAGTWNLSCRCKRILQETTLMAEIENLTFGYLPLVVTSGYVLTLSS